MFGFLPEIVIPRMAIETVAATPKMRFAVHGKRNQTSRQTTGWSF